MKDSTMTFPRLLAPEQSPEQPRLTTTNPRGFARCVRCGHLVALAVARALVDDGRVGCQECYDDEAENRRLGRLNRHDPPIYGAGGESTPCSA